MSSTKTQADASYAVEQAGHAADIGAASPLDVEICAASGGPFSR